MLAPPRATEALGFADEPSPQSLYHVGQRGFALIPVNAIILFSGGLSAPHTSH